MTRIYISIKTLVLIGSLTAALVLGSPAEAATVSCTVSSNQTTIYTATGAVVSPGNPAGDCFDGGAGNINGSGIDAFLDAHGNEGYVSIAKLDYGQTSAGFQVTGNFSESKTGTWTITQSILDQYDGLALGLKAGNSWATILLTDGLSTGTWSTSRGISHINLYGILAATPQAVPGPIAGAGLPALIALGGLVWARRRKAAATA